MFVLSATYSWLVHTKNMRHAGAAALHVGMAPSFSCSQYHGQYRVDASGGSGAADLHSCYIVATGPAELLWLVQQPASVHGTESSSCCDGSLAVQLFELRCLDPPLGAVMSSEDAVLHDNASVVDLYCT